MTERLLTAAELAERLALSTSTVLDWFEAGRLPGFKLGRVVRFREPEIVAWLEARRSGRGREEKCYRPLPFTRPGAEYPSRYRPLLEEAEMPARQRGSTGPPRQDLGCPLP